MSTATETKPIKRTARKATRLEARLKVLVWGESGSGKSRLGLSFPKPLVADLEKSTQLYGDEFNFLVAEPTEKLPPHALVAQLLNECNEGMYLNEAETFVIDPATDYLDALEFALIEEKRKGGVNFENLKGPQRAKFYHELNDGRRKRLNRIVQLPMHVVFIARAKNLWGQADGGLQPIDRTFDAHEIVESLCDIVLHLQRDGTAIVKKSRLAQLPQQIKAATFADIQRALQDARDREPEPLQQPTAAPVQVPEGAFEPAAQPDPLDAISNPNAPRPDVQPLLDHLLATIGEANVIGLRSPVDWLDEYKTECRYIGADIEDEKQHYSGVVKAWIFRRGTLATNMDDYTKGMSKVDQWARSLLSAADLESVREFEEERQATLRRRK